LQNRAAAAREQRACASYCLHQAYGLELLIPRPARQSRCGTSQGFRGVDFEAVRERIEPAFAKRLRRGSLRLLRYDKTEGGLPSRSLRSKRRLVGATGIEPVTPTMSTQSVDRNSCKIRPRNPSSFRLRSRLDHGNLGHFLGAGPAAS
jgi:hypothetical protein